MSEIFLIFEMNGHGFFIWSAYGVWFVLLMLLFANVLLLWQNSTHLEISQ